MYDYFIEYNTFNIGDIWDIHICLMKKHYIWIYQKMYTGLLRAWTIGYFSVSSACNSKGPLKYMSLNNWPYQTRPTLVDKNSNENLFYQFTVSATKCDGSFYWWSMCCSICSKQSKKYECTSIIFNIMDKWNKIFSSVWIAWE